MFFVVGLIYGVKPNSGYKDIIFSGWFDHNSCVIVYFERTNEERLCVVHILYIMLLIFEDFWAWVMALSVYLTTTSAVVKWSLIVMLLMQPYIYRLPFLLCITVHLEWRWYNNKCWVLQCRDCWNIHCDKRSKCHYSANWIHFNTPLIIFSDNKSLDIYLLVK